MLILLSPAKTLDYSESPVKAEKAPKFRKDSQELINILKNKSVKDLMQMMHIKENLASLNFQRFQDYSSSFTAKNSKPAILAFKGDVYVGLDAATLNQRELDFTQEHVRILSGLYGILKPLDKMQPYRLEMGSKLKTEHGINLYHFWGDKLTKEINRTLKLQNSDIVINLASQEYFKALDRKKIKADILDINFRENRDGKLKFISYSAKKARGLMTRYIIKNKIMDTESIKGFNYENYYFDQDLSDDKQLTFVR